MHGFSPPSANTLPLRPALIRFRAYFFRQLFSGTSVAVGFAPPPTLSRRPWGWIHLTRHAPRLFFDPHKPHFPFSSRHRVRLSGPSPLPAPVLERKTSCFEAGPRLILTFFTQAQVFTSSPYTPPPSSPPTPPPPFGVTGRVPRMHPPGWIPGSETIPPFFCPNCLRRSRANFLCRYVIPPHIVVATKLRSSKKNAPLFLISTFRSLVSAL